jgi:glucoamylase
MDKLNAAPGRPGISPRWTSAAKSGTGTAINQASRIWFTISHGILNEIYYPRIDRACTRDCGLIVTDGQNFFSEEKRHTDHYVSYLGEGVPGYRIVNSCKGGRYRIEKEIVSSPSQDAVLQRIRFIPQIGNLEDYHLYVLLAPHLGNKGSGQTAYIGEHKGVPMLIAERNAHALSLSCSAPWAKRSVGFVGASDGWQDLSQHKQMLWQYDRAEDGNVALTGEIDLKACNGYFVLTLGFGTDPEEAGYRALSSLLDGFDLACRDYVEEWADWQKQMMPLPLKEEEKESGFRDLYHLSTAVMKTHEAKSFLGGIIASLSIPWGSSKGDEDLGGYHLVWPRDLIEIAMGLLASGSGNTCTCVLKYLRDTQDPDGKWPQNMWLDGKPYWSGVQMDETALPILLLERIYREGVLNREELGGFWQMVFRAASYLVRNGPVTQEDRWETDPGYSPFTLAVEIAALLAAADIADLMNENRIAVYLRETADYWNANLERWTYVEHTEFCKETGVGGHYVRIGYAGQPDTVQGSVSIKDRPPRKSNLPRAYILGTDALAYVRFGLRDPHDPRILNTIKVIDTFLKKDTPFGPAWRRYLQDQYGEHEDGSPYNGTGIGRAWPLLTSERAHYELAAGNRKGALELLRAMEAFANEGGMIPEQIWDAPDIPERELFCGRATGSAAPLVWAHAEYVKLRRSLYENEIFDMPPQAVERYLIQKIGSPFVTWRFNNRIRQMPGGKALRIETLAPALIRWTIDEWQSSHDAQTNNTGLGVHSVDIAGSDLNSAREIEFTFYWLETQNWEDKNFDISIT